MFQRILRILRNLTLMLVAAILVMVYLVVAAINWRSDTDKDKLLPDFIAQISCPGTTAPTDEFWEDNFTQLGFRPLNIAAVAQQHGIDYPVSGQHIWGLGPGDRILSVYSSSRGGYVSFALKSPPPTVHDVQLEAMMRTIVDQTRCEINSIRTAENKPPSRPMFFSTLKLIKGWYAEVDALDHH